MAISRLSQTSAQNAFQKYNSIWDGTSAIGSMETISTVTNASSIQFASIPQTYTHLQIRALVKTTSGSVDNSIIRFNSDSVSGHYYHHYLQGNGTSVTAGALINSNSSCIITGYTPASGSTSIFSTMVIDILDYANTNKYKTVKVLSGYDANGSGYVGLYSGVWLFSNAITTIDFGGYAAGLNTTTTAALYGIK